MDIDNIDAFLKEIKPSLDALGKRRDTKIGFNAFALVSDTYYRENFHSDIIRSILDPSSPHGEGFLFVELFIRYLERVARAKGKSDLADILAKLPLDGTITVKREEGRVDVKIEAAEWTIIVENKINGAGDMERQIPRYIEESGGLDRVKVVVYLTAAQEKTPCQYGWSDDDTKIVNDRLLPIVGYSETKTIPNLVEGWLEPCELRARSFNARSVLSQYGELVRNQAGETMDEVEVRKLFDFIKNQKIDLPELVKMLNGLPEVLAQMIGERFNGKSGVKSSWVWHRTVGVVDLEDVQVYETRSCSFAIDVECALWGVPSIQFFSREEDVDDMDGFLPLLQAFDSHFVLDGRIVLRYEASEVYQDVEGFILKIEKLIEYLSTAESRACLKEVTSNYV